MREAAGELVQQIRAKARASGPVADPVSADAVRAAEERLGFALPQLLVDIYTTVGDGGFGPGDDISIPHYNAGRLYPLQRLVELYFLKRMPDPDYTPWPEGVVPMLYWGCFAEAAIDCFDEAAPVLLYDSDTDTVSPDDAWKIDAPSLFEWWSAWLNGTLREPTELWIWPSHRRP